MTIVDVDPDDDPWTWYVVMGDGFPTPGCDCTHDGLALQWHLSDCASEVVQIGLAWSRARFQLQREAS